MKYIPAAVLLSLLLFSALLCGCTGSPSPSIQSPHISGNAPIDLSGPRSISKPGYYRLTDDLFPTDDTVLSKTTSPVCIRISSSDVTLDGMGHVIDGSKITKIKKDPDDNSRSIASTGISVTERYQNDWVSNVIIKNITIRNWYWGIKEYHVKDSDVHNIVAQNNSNGIFLTHTSGIVIRNSTFIQNDNYGVIGTDIEKTTLTDNEFNTNRYAGISADGKLQMVLSRIIFGRLIILPGILFDQSQTSGNGLDIIRNSVSDSRDGIRVTNTNSNKIISNTISNASRGIALYNCGSEKKLENNTFFQTGKDLSESNYTPPFSVFFGILLLIFLKVFANALNVGLDIVTKPLKEKFFFKPETPEGFRADQAPSVFHCHLPTIARNNLLESVIGAIILGAAFVYAQYARIDLFPFIMMTLIAGIVLVTHEFVHFYTAQRVGLRADFRLWGAGVIITLLSSVIFREVFGQTVLTTIRDEESSDRRKIALVMLSGPLVSLVLSSAFYIVSLTQGSVASFAMFGFEMSLMTAFVSFLPIASLDGERVYKWNRLIWAAVFIPLYLVYGYFFIYQDLLVLFIPIVIGVVACGLWRFKERLSGKINPSVLKWSKRLLISIAVLVIARITNYFFSGLYSIEIIRVGTPLNNLILLITVLSTIAAIFAIIISCGAIIFGFLRRS